MSATSVGRVLVVLSLLISLRGPALRAQQSADTVRAPQVLDTLVIRGRSTDLTGVASSANQGSVGAADIASRPILRPGEIVENVPGVIVTQHSGSGKANQYFLRGFNLDHGTDLAISVDDVPINMPSHAHGQGYADINFLIPELVRRVDYEKGPYYADVGDFGAAGAFAIHYYDRLPMGLVTAEGGGIGYGRLLVANNAAIGGGNLIHAIEFEHDDGPWDTGDNARKFSGMLRYSRGDATRGASVTAAGYHNQWHSTDQVPDRAISEGLIDRWGEIDSTDAGNNGRYSLSAEWHARGNSSASQVSAYLLHYDLDLFSDFTYFLDDPVHGDQIEQQDHRWVAGADARHSWIGAIGTAATQTTLGVQLRSDAIDNGLYHTEARVRLDAVTADHIDETSGAPYLENRTYWSRWFRTIVGLRADRYHFGVQNRIGGASGSVDASLLSPKISLIAGPFHGTEFYLDAGEGFHSNDARGVVTPVNAATPLVRGKGAEFGVRTAAARGLQSSVSFWLLDLASELVWDGDAGGNTPSGPTRRYGIELANFYAPARWLTLDADYAWSHTRFTDDEPDGPYVPEALVSTFDGGAAIHQLGGGFGRWRADARVRYFGPRPLTQDNSVRSQATTLVYAGIGLDLGHGWSTGVNVFNLLNTRASDIDYYYTSRLPGEPLSGVNDVHTHPAEGREVRVAVTRALGKAGGD